MQNTQVRNEGEKRQRNFFLLFPLASQGGGKKMLT